MATILIVDDRSANREYLTTLLGYSGHSLLEARDGAEGLAVARAEQPDLVITDILMPTMDGYEFVRHLRTDEAVAGTRVIFFTAHYREPEARRLAAACGVTDVLTKPCEPELVLKTVEAALGHASAPTVDPTPPPEEFDQAHLHLLTDKLSRQADEARRKSERLAALVELGLQLGSERDPKRLLQAFCDASREIVGARYAVVGIPDGNGAAYRFFLTGGMDLATAARVGRPGPLEGVLGSVLAAGRCFRAANHGGLDAAGLPASFPRASALLVAPVVSPARIHGWVCLLDKVGGDAFTDEDERLVRMLGAQVGRIYENGSLYADLLRHSTKLAEEVAERQRAEAAMLAGEAYMRGFFEASSAGMVEADTGTGRIMRANATYCRMLGYTPDEIVGLSPENFVLPEDLPEMTASYTALREGRIDAYDTERRYRRKDGSELWVQSSAALVRDADGRPARIAAVLTDLSARKQAEAELRRTTELLKAVADGTTDAVFVKDRTGKYLLCNPATARFFGLTPDDLIGRSDEELFGPADARVVAENDRRVLETGQTETSEEVLTMAGVVRTFLATKGPYRDENGEVVGVIGISRDITDRKQAEETLRLRDRAIQAVSQGILITDPNQPDNPIIFANSGCERITGYTAAEYIGRNCRFLQGKDTDPAAVARMREAIKTGQPCQVEILNYRKNGRPFWNELSITPVLDPTGRLTHFVGVQTDVTARKEAEDALRAGEERYRRLLDSIPDPLFVYDRETLRYLAANNAAVASYGYSREELYEMTIADIRPPEDVSRLLAILDQSPGGLEFRGEWRHRRKDGSVFDVEITAHDIELDGRPACIVTARDLTDRKRAEEELRASEERFRQSQKMEAVGRLAGGVAHDFNNLLTIINGYGELVLGGLQPNDPNRELIREMVAAGERAAGLTRQLLAFSRKSIIEPKLLDLKVVVTDVERMLRRVVGEDIQLAVAADPEIGTVRADQGHVEQVLLNLVVNARDAMPTGGKLTIEVRNVELDETYTRDHPDARPGPHVVLAVADTGCGMDAATVSRIFEPFFSTKGEHGTGLGLATVHGIVKQSGGHVAVYSELGRGTTFKVYLPQAENLTPARGSRLTRSPLARGGETILLVEDEDGVRALTRHVLRNCGYTVLEAQEGAEALRLISEHLGRIDLLVTDVVMPRMGGREVAQRVTELHPGVKVLFLSGYTDDAIVRHGILEAEVSFLQKPFTPASLAAKIREVLDAQ